MRFGYLLTACVFSACLTTHAESGNNAPSFNRAQSVINTFQVMCTLERPKFDDISAKATAMRMKLQSDKKLPATGGTNVRQKVWGGRLTTGPFALLLDEMSDAKGTATSCAIIAEVPNADAFRMEAMSTMKFAAMKIPELGADGSRSYIWDGVYGPGTTLILRDFKPSGKLGAMLKLQSMQRK